jgi:hypothetical protein
LVVIKVVTRVIRVVTRVIRIVIRVVIRTLYYASWYTFGRH